MLEKNDIDRAFVADQRITELSRERGSKFPQLEFVTGWLGEKEVIDAIPEVDALLMYDIRLHQANPDWDKFLELWSKKARVIVIFNQMWMQDNSTIRFIERGAEWYKKNVHMTDEKKVDQWFASHDQIDQASGKLQKERHAFWQWGITTDDLISYARSLGLRLDFFENHRKFGPSLHPWIQDEAFIFVRREDTR